MVVLEGGGMILMSEVPLYTSDLKGAAMCRGESGIRLQGCLAHKNPPPHMTIQYNMPRVLL